MAQEIVMPKLGNTVESVVIVEWKKSPGDRVSVGEAICEVETDKATVDVESEHEGTLLARLFENDDEVDVLVPFAIIGEEGEDISALISSAAGASSSSSDGGTPDSEASSATEASRPAGTPTSAETAEVSGQAAAPTAGMPASGISPRARNLAASSGLDGYPAAGSGPGGRVIERDVKAVLEGRAPLTPAARSLGGPAPSTGSGIGGRVTAADMTSFVPAADTAASPAAAAKGTPDFPGPVDSVPVKGIRQVIARRMLASLQDTAQLTLNGSASATSLLDWRAGFKNSPEEFGVAIVSINDLVMYTTVRLLLRYPELNATFGGDSIKRYSHVHLGFAVDTPKGLMVPVIRFADRLSLVELSAEARRLALACRDGKASPDELQGGTFTITNLGAFGIESFTPVLNAPEVAILGVGNIVNRPIEKADGSVGLEKRIGLSLTIDHQAVDGAPGARFLRDLSTMLGRLEWALAQ